MGKLAGEFITGVKELDDVLRTMEDKEIRSAVVKATDQTITKYVRPSFIQKVEEAGLVETGALRDVAQKRRVKRSRTQFGSQLFINRFKVIELRRERGGRIGFDKKRHEPFFYPAKFEYGTDDGSPPAPLRLALMGSKDVALLVFNKYLREAITKIIARCKAKKTI